MSKYPKISMTFFLTGDEIIIGEVTKILGINPTKVKHFSEFRPQIRSAGYGKTSWSYSIDNVNSRSISDCFNMLVSVLKPKKDRIIEVCNKYCCETTINFGVKMEGTDFPEVILYKNDIEFASSIGAEIGFSFYDL